MVKALNASLLTLACFFTAQAKERGPNVLFIAVDDLAASLGCYGDLVAKTPHLDALAGKGIRFERAYNQIPLCNPSRASIMTGLRPDEIKVYDLDRHFRKEVPKVTTLSQHFINHDYYTARVGKIYHYNVPASIGTDGFDDAPSWMETFNPKGRDKTDEHLVFNAEPHRKISGALSWLAADGAAGRGGARKVHRTFHLTMLIWTQCQNIDNTLRAPFCTCWVPASLARRRRSNAAGFAASAGFLVTSISKLVLPFFM